MSPSYHPKYTKPEDSAEVRESLAETGKHMKNIITERCDRRELSSIPSTPFIIHD